jgi:UDP-4-amino-4,6-dideoxy-N-acetyl-beta-L-altrosamine N-acetyltransferase
VLSYRSFTHRPIEAADEALTFRWRNHPAVREAMFPSGELTPEGHRAWMGKMLADPTRAYFIFIQDQRPVGVFGFYNIDLSNRRAEWAFYLGHDIEDRPKGLGRAMWFFALEHFFASDRFDRLWSQVLSSNARAVKMHEAYGFTREGVLREHQIKNGNVLDVVCLGMLRREWQAASPLRRAELFS